MSDPFIDALHNRLKTADATYADGAHEGARAVGINRWWGEFVEVLGQKVGAWNERQVPEPPINFTKRANGDVQVWHRSADATFTRTGDGVTVSTRLGTQPRRESILDLRIAHDESVVAMFDGEELATASGAAEHLLTPVLVETFAIR